MPSPSSGRFRCTPFTRVSEHYSGHDPATGCGLMMIAGAAGLVGFVLGFVVGWLLG